MRPRLKLEKQPLDKALEIIGIMAVIAMLALPVYYWADIPDVIPTHYNTLGQPDDYGSKWTAMVLPLIGAALFVALHWLNRFPHIFNYAGNITPDNAHQHYRMATRLLRIVGVVVALSFAYLTYTVIHTSLGNMSGPGSGFVAIFMVSMLIVPISYLLISRNVS